MTQEIKLLIDPRGHILIPQEIQDRLGLVPGMTLIAEKAEAGNVRLTIQQKKTILVEKHGVLIARGKPMKDITNISEDEHNRRACERLERVNL
mgnify:CR=1 FL=1